MTVKVHPWSALFDDLPYAHAALVAVDFGSFYPLPAAVEEAADRVMARPDAIVILKADLVRLNVRLRGLSAGTTIDTTSRPDPGPKVPRTPLKFVREGNDFVYRNPSPE